MEGGSRASRGDDSRGDSGERSTSSWIELSPEVKDILRPWIDVDEVGREGVLSWLRSILPLIPRTRTSDRRASEDPSERIQELAVALSECSSDRARVHFQAAEYYRENQVLARRVKALEAMLRSPPTQAPAEDLEVERASRRYLPRGADRG